MAAGWFVACWGIKQRQLFFSPPLCTHSNKPPQAVHASGTPDPLLFFFFCPYMQTEAGFTAVSRLYVQCSSIHAHELQCMCLAKSRLKWTWNLFPEICGYLMVLMKNLLSVCGIGGRTTHQRTSGVITAVVTATLAAFVDVQIWIHLYLYSICY